MLLNARIPAAALAAALLLSAGTARAAEEPGSGSIGFQLGFYAQPDGGSGADGNPFLDEELTVIEPVIVFDYQINAADSVWALFSYDYVSSASIDRLSKFPQQSGASGDYYFGLDAGWRHRLDDRRSRGLFVSGSVEYDYRSFGFGGDYAHDFPELGGSLKLTGSAFFDTLDVIRFNGVEEGTDQRFTLSAGGTWYQTFSPKLHATYGATLTLQNGFLETPYNAVVIEDGSGPNPNLVGNAPGREVVEVLPDTRVRGALHGQLRHTAGADGAVELGGRLYADDWGIVGLSLEPAYHHWLVPDRHRLRLGYRFYTQTAADAYAEHFTAEEAERTQDADLADFIANSLGVSWIWTPANGDTFSFGVDYTMRSDDLNYLMVNAGYKRPF